MSRPSKSKKNKVPKITEEEYAAYVSAIKTPAPQNIAPQERNGAQITQKKA